MLQFVEPCRQRASPSVQSVMVRRGDPHRKAPLLACEAQVRPARPPFAARKAHGPRRHYEGGRLGTVSGVVLAGRVGRDGLSLERDRTRQRLTDERR